MKADAANSVAIDCTKPNNVVDALQTQVSWLVEKRVAAGVEAMCSRPYNEALFLKENRPAQLSVVAPRLLSECNQALKGFVK
jgi:phage I-like protein